MNMGILSFIRAGFTSPSGIASLQCLELHISHIPVLPIIILDAGQVNQNFEKNGLLRTTRYKKKLVLAKTPKMSLSHRQELICCFPIKY